jgi:hypothetical protein
LCDRNIGGFRCKSFIPFFVQLFFVQDIEFTLDNFSKLPSLIESSTLTYGWHFGFEAFAGSFVDGGIGEVTISVAPQYTVLFVLANLQACRISCKLMRYFKQDSCVHRISTPISIRLHL